MNSAHEFYMRRALALARQAWGQTHPNPMVGALIVENDTIVAEGFHQRDGEPHAERNALNALGRKPSPDATLYITLEPCSTEGRTGSCAEAIIQSGIKNVVVGATDPNPHHAGRAYQIFRSADIACTHGVLEAECNDLNLIFNHWIRHESPLIAAKIATTLDGKIATRSGHSRWITGDPARLDVHRWRQLFPAISVGAMTVNADNPRLTIRLEGQEEQCNRRFIFDGLLRSVTDPLPNIYTDAFREKTTVVTTQHGGEGYLRKLRDAGISTWVFDSPTHSVNFADFKKRLAAENITALYIEGGSTLISSLLRQRHIDYLFNYHAPILFADNKAKPAYNGLRPDRLDQAVSLANVRHETFGNDSLVRGQVQYPDNLVIDETLLSLRQ